MASLIKPHCVDHPSSKPFSSFLNSTSFTFESRQCFSRRSEVYGNKYDCGGGSFSVFACSALQCGPGKVGQSRREGNVLQILFQGNGHDGKAAGGDLYNGGETDTCHVSSAELNLRAMTELKPSAANSTPLTPLGFLERAATVYGDSISIVYNQTEYKWSETYDRCRRVASLLSKMGIGKHEVVSVLAPNVPAMYELHFAVPMAGAVLNNINTRLDARTMSILLQHSGSKVVFVDCLLRCLAVEAIALFPPNEVKPKLVLITDEYESEDYNSLTAPFYESYEDLVRRGDSGFETVMPESEWDPIVLNYTSGTTSSPKGVVLSHRGVFLLAIDSLVEWSVPKQPIYLWTLSMFHANGWCYTWGMAAVGGTNICVRKFDAPLIYDLIVKHGVTHMCGAPIVLNMLSNSKDAKPLKTPVKVMTAGAPPPAAVLFRIESLGFSVSHGYGLTETGGPVVTCAWKPQWNNLPASEKARLKARQGIRMLSLTEVNVINPITGASVPRDGLTIGEVVLRGGFVMLGYYKDPDSTAKAMSLSNGWLLSGDVGVMHEDGYLEVKDRSKDVIISGGENLSSVEVESILFTHPDVNEAAVVAKPDAFWGETPCAFVSLKTDLIHSPSEKELREYCKGKMPRYMVPRTVVFMEELPKTSTGKVQKYLLRELAKALGQVKKKAQIAN